MYPENNRSQTRWSRACWYLLAFALLVACQAPGYDHRPEIFSAVPARWQQAGEWQFYVTDMNDEPAGELVLLLSSTPLESESCDTSGWYRADVIDNTLDMELAAEMIPGYMISGPWITVDLSATSCNTGYKLIGTLSENGASGHVSFVHSIGGEHIGNFVAMPVSR